MNRKILNNKVIKQKITCFFILLSFLFSQVFYVKNVYAGLPVVDLPAFGFDTSNKVLDKILEAVGGVAASAISSLLTNYAKESGQRVVEGLATGNWGNEPLFYNLPYEDYLTAALDNVAGTFLDEINAENKFDLCKPMDDFSINWKFKIMLNIKPDLASFDKTEKAGPVCTLSKFVAATKKSLSTIITSVKKALVGDCFDEFISNDVCGEAANALSGIYTVGAALSGSVTNFNLQGIKDVFGYNGSINFCKKTAYYIKKGADLSVSKLTAEIVKRNWCNDPIAMATKLDDSFWTTNKADCERYDDNRGAAIVGLNISNINGVINSGGCLYSMDYCKFISDQVVIDKTKRKSFINQYNNCFTPKLTEYIGNIIEVGDIEVSQEKIVSNGIEKNCQDSLSAVLASSNGDIYRAAINIKNKNNAENFYLYIAKYLDGFLSSNSSTGVTVGSYDVTFGGKSIASDETDNSETRKKQLIGRFVPIIAKTTSDCFEKLEYGADALFLPTGAHFLYCKAGNGTITSPILYYHDAGFKNEIIIPTDDSSTYVNESAKNEIYDYCKKLSLNAYSVMQTEEDISNRVVIEQQQQKLEEDLLAKASEADKTYPDASFAKDVTTEIGGQVTTSGELVADETKNSLKAGSNLLQPSDTLFGAVFIDPVKIFITTILNSSSNIIMNGLFKIIPTAADDPANEGLDLDEIYSEALNEGNECVVGTAAYTNGSICYKNSDCNSCCCNTSYSEGVGDGILYCRPQEWCSK